ncbi:MAG: tyrosine-type recombinase/integrase [Acidimicrobiales bacterium]|nr:tyrosine-type recombinase/integrase [Acidimicrobiales bacterium]
MSFQEQWKHALATDGPTPNPRHFNRRPANVAETFNAMTVAVLGTHYIRFISNEMEHLLPDRRNEVRRIIRQYVIEGSLKNRFVDDLIIDDMAMFRDELRGKGLAYRTQFDILRRFQDVMRYGINTRRSTQPPFTEIKPKKPKQKRLPGAAKRTQPTYWSLERSRRLADHLPVFMYRLVFWTMRACGLRISEVYGLTVASISPEGLAFIDTQGGKLFWDEDDDDEWFQTHMVKRVKTQDGYRWVCFPPSLLRAIRRHVMDVYGADPLDGTLDPELPIFVRKAGAKPSHKTYYAAFAKALIAAKETLHDIGYKVKPHFNRKLWNTQFVQHPSGVTDAERNRLMGHKGDLVHGNTRINRDVYTLPDFSIVEHALRAAEEMEAALIEAFGDDDYLADIEYLLVDFPAYTVPEATRYLGVSRCYVNALVRKGVLWATDAQTVTGRTVRVVRVEDVHAYAEQRENAWTTGRAHSEFGIPIRTLRRWCETRQVKAVQARSGDWHMDEESLRRKCAEWEADNKNGYSLTEAAARLSSTAVGVRQMVAAGDLVAMPMDSRGRERVSKPSVERALSRRRHACRNAS